MGVYLFYFSFNVDEQKKTQKQEAQLATFILGATPLAPVDCCWDEFGAMLAEYLFLTACKSTIQ